MDPLAENKGTTFRLSSTSPTPARRGSPVVSPAELLAAHGTLLGRRGLRARPIIRDAIASLTELEGRCRLVGVC